MKYFFQVRGNGVGTIRIGTVLWPTLRIVSERKVFLGERGVLTQPAATHGEGQGLENMRTSPAES